MPYHEMAEYRANSSLLLANDVIRNHFNTSSNMA